VIQHHDALHLLDILLQAEHEIAAVRSGDPYALYELLHEIASRIAHTDAFYIALYSEADETLFFPYKIDGRIHDTPSTVSLGKGPSSWVVRYNKPFVLNTENEATQRAGGSFGVQERASRSAVHVPLRAINENGHEEVIGVLSAQSYQRDAYDGLIVRALQWLADCAARRMHRERNESELNDQVESATLRAVEERQRLFTAVDEFLRMLAEISTQAETVRQLLPGNNAALHNAVEQLCRECHRTRTQTNLLPLRLRHSTPELANVTTDQTARVLDLTRRERQVAELLACGASNGTISRELHISVETVKFHCANIYGKIGMSRRIHAAQFLSKHLHLAEKTPPSSRSKTPPAVS
jgi:DNA-binding CsgD family transcriptional regulator